MKIMFVEICANTHVCWVLLRSLSVLSNYDIPLGLGVCWGKLLLLLLLLLLLILLLLLLLLLILLLLLKILLT